MKPDNNSQGKKASASSSSSSSSSSGSSHPHHHYHHHMSRHISRLFVHRQHSAPPGTVRSPLLCVSFFL
jgi:hypothetical protein